MFINQHLVNNTSIKQMINLFYHREIYSISYNFIYVYDILYRTFGVIGNKISI